MLNCNREIGEVFQMDEQEVMVVGETCEDVYSPDPQYFPETVDISRTDDGGLIVHGWNTLSKGMQKKVIQIHDIDGVMMEDGVMQ